MYANVVVVSAGPDSDRKQVTEGVIPRVKQQPGFVGGYWMAPLDGKGMSVAVFENEQAARDAIDSLGLKPGVSPAPGVTIERIETREVIGHA